MIIRQSGQIDATDQAIAKFEEALAHFQNDPFTIFALAQCFERKGMYARAIPLLERVMDSAYEDTRNKVRPLLLACYQRTGDMMSGANLRAKMGGTASGLPRT